MWDTTRLLVNWLIGYDVHCLVGRVTVNTCLHIRRGESYSQCVLVVVHNTVVHTLLEGITSQHERGHTTLQRQLEGRSDRHTMGANRRGQP